MNPIPSPCTRNCCLDQDDICMGCYRSMDEILQWNTVDHQLKRQIIENTIQRKQSKPRSLFSKLFT